MNSYSRSQIFVFIMSLAISVTLPATLAAAPEVQGLRFDSATRLEWDGQAGILGYNLDRSAVATSGGDCRRGAIQGSGTDDADLPAPDASFYYLVTAFDETGDGSAGQASNSDPRIVGVSCKPVRRFFPLTANGDNGDGVEDGVDPRQNSSSINWPTAGGELGVLLHTGETRLRAVDLSIRGRSIPEHSVEFFRTYRSQIDYDGPLGHGWDFNLNARLAPLGADVIYHDGRGRRDVFARDVMSSFFRSPTGLYAVLKENPDSSFTLRDPHGTLYDFHTLLDGSSLEGALESIEDRNGNRTALLYDDQGLLTTVVDALGRSLSFDYDGNGRLISVTDFAGRGWSYSFDLEGNLTGARTPIVTGTPNGNDFPGGKTEGYGYTAGFGDERMNHNLLSVTAPNEQGSGPPRVQLDYGVDPVAFDFDRATTLTIGGVNTSAVDAGGTATLSYESLNPGGNPADLLLPRRRATLTDRNGNLVEFVHNRDGNLLQRTDFTNRDLRPGEPDYVTSFEYNSDGETLRLLSPEGSETLFTYDSAGVDRYRQGNLLEVRRIAGPRGDGEGGPLDDLVTTYTYEPVYNRVRTITDARGNDPSYVPQNGGAHSSDRYTWEWLYDHQEGHQADNGIEAYAGLYEIDLTGANFDLGDLNGDGNMAASSGNCVREEAPSVALDPGSHQAGIASGTTQSIVATYRWNAFGQIASHTDAEENVHEYSYHPETDPDGDGNPTPAPADQRTLDPTSGGYLSSLVRDTAGSPDRNNKTDPPPAAVQHTFLWDAVGNNTHAIDGRGVLTRNLFNALDQLVELRRAAATGDASGPDGDPATGRGEAGLTPFSYKMHYEYDANDNLLARRVEDAGETRGVGPEVDTTYEYDLLDRRIRTNVEVEFGFLITETRYDANENLTQVTRPEGNVDEIAFDERDLLLRTTRGASGPRGGTPSVELYDYDGNGNLLQLTDPRSNLTDYVYDGFDRPVSATDEVGNVSRFEYDPADRLVVRQSFGPVDGPTPLDRLGTGNVELSRTDYLYDELYRPIRVDDGLFVPSGTAPGRAPNITEGPLVPGDAALNRILEYDRLSRLTFEDADTLASLRHDYDGLGRQVKETLPDGSFVESFHDAAHNRIERVETEKSSSVGPADDVFVTTYAYDALDRLTRAVDNVGQTWRYAYDSLDRVTTASDALGPPGGSINRLSPGQTGVSVLINGHGNVTRYGYDGPGRLLARTSVLTASGKGNGTMTPVPDLTNPFNPDGLISIQTEWDDNSLPARSIDDRGNETTYTYDNLNRRTLVTHDDATTTQYFHDPNDNVVQRIDAHGASHESIYDAANRRTRLDLPPLAGIEGTTLQTYEYDGLHRLTRTTDDNDPVDATDDITIELLYDSLGRQIEEKQTRSDGTATLLTDYHWQSDLVSRLAYPSGREIDYLYDGADRLSSISDTDPGRNESASYDYFGVTRVHTRTLGNGVRTTIAFDGARRVVDLLHLDGDDALLGGFEYAYDRMSNPTIERRAHHAVGDIARGERHSYDSMYRLIQFEEGDLDGANAPAGPSVDAWSWTVDGADNWPLMTRNGVSYGATPNNLNEFDEMQSGGGREDDGVPDDFGDDVGTPAIDGINLGHNKKGDRTRIGTRDSAYDALSRTRRTSDPIAMLDFATYSYDALGRRIRKDVQNLGPLDETLRFSYSGGTLIAEQDGAGVTTREVVGTGPLRAGRKLLIELERKGTARLSGGGVRVHEGTGCGSDRVGGHTIKGGIVSLSLVGRGYTLKGSTVNVNTVGGGTGSGMGSLLGGYGGIIKECSYDENTDIGGGTGSGMGIGRESAATAYDEVIHLSPRRPLWQLRNDGTSQYLLEDGRGNVSLLIDGTTAAVLERVTYDAWGKPMFEDAANNPRFADGKFDARSELGNPDLWGGLRYDPEHGERTADPNTDRGGFFLARSGGGYFDPNLGRGTVRGALIGGGSPSGAFVKVEREQLRASRHDRKLLGHEVTHVAQSRMNPLGGGSDPGSGAFKAKHDTMMAVIQNTRMPIRGGVSGSTSQGIVAVRKLETTGHELRTIAPGVHPGGGGQGGGIINFFDCFFAAFGSGEPSGGGKTITCSYDTEMVSM